MAQIKYQFDKETLLKIGKGALIAGGGAAGLYILNWVGTLQFENPVLTSIMAWFIPFMINAIKEWRKGE